MSIVAVVVFECLAGALLPIGSLASLNATLGPSNKWSHEGLLDDSIGDALALRRGARCCFVRDVMGETGSNRIVSD